MKKPFIIFFLIIFGILGIIGFWYWQGNIYSKEILKLEILGPEQVKTGEEIEYLVRLKNNGKTRLEEVELIFEFPNQSIPSKAFMLRNAQKIEDIYPGEERTYPFKARLFGKENDIMEANVCLSYRPKNLKAFYQSETIFISQIKFVPLTFEFDMSSNVGQGEEMNFSLNYFSNINEILENLRIKIQYPMDFEFKESNPIALDENEWPLYSLSQASGGRIEIKGIIEHCEQGEEKIFRAQLGILKNDEFWLLKEAAQSVKIVESSLYFSALINNSLEYSASAGDFLHYEIFFRNTGKKPIQKKFLFAELDGNFFDLSTLTSKTGEFGQGDNTIIWDWKKVPRLRFLDTTEEGKVEFWIKLKQDIGHQIKNPKLRLKVDLAGTEKIFETKINSQIVLNQKVYFEQEFFENEGPLPPNIGEKTTYVVLWQVRNFWNDFENVKVKTQLPEYIRPTGKIFPEEAKFTYDSESRILMWNIGDIKAWQSFESSPLVLAFQIEFLPLFSQKGETPFLVNEAEVSGEDIWTLEIFESAVEGRDTTLPDDQSVSAEQGIVE